MPKVQMRKCDDLRFKFEKEGQVLKGKYVGSEDFEFQGKMLTKHRVVDEEGKTVGFLGGHTLNEGLPQVPVGSFVTIKFLGKRSLRGGKTVAEYEIDYEEPASL